MRRSRFVLLPLAIAAIAVVMASCASNFRVLQPPTPGATAPPRSTTSTLGFTSTTVSAFSISSSAIAPESRIPSEFTCEGAGTSPPVSFSGVPANAKQLALLVLDTDDNNSPQWLVTGMPTDLLGITKGAKPVGGTVVVPWKPPCPTTGTHSYEFELLALPQTPLVGTDDLSDPAALVKSLQQESTQSAAFTASFGK
jgi:phosphatidylethanolamine-binding protein (PEBP) family uncharacterized protein